jgi:RHS repeat-associated protein
MQRAAVASRPAVTHELVLAGRVLTMSRTVRSLQTCLALAGLWGFATACDDAYHYDHRNLRIAKGRAGSTRRFSYDARGRLLADADAGGETVEYVWLGGAPVLVLQDLDGSGGGTATPYVLGTDEFGTPMRAFIWSTGVITWAADYTPFGHASTYVPGDPGTPSPTINVRFPGQYWDVETGLHYNWHRYYDPHTGRYAQPEPLLTDRNFLASGRLPGSPPQFQSYGYAAANPLRYVDPDGRSPVGWVIKLGTKGYRKVRRLFDLKDAIRARGQGLNILLERESLSEAAEIAANGGDCTNIIRHKGHQLADGELGLPHYQTDGLPGHSFWGPITMMGMIEFLGDALNPVDAISGELGRPEDMQRMYELGIYDMKSPIK